MFVNEWLMAIVVFFVWYFYQINHVGNAKDPLTLRAAVKNSRQIVFALNDPNKALVLCIPNYFRSCAISNKVRIYAVLIDR